MKRMTIFAVCCLVLINSSLWAADFRFSPNPNKAHLIQWRNWSADALNEAQARNKLILLSISAVWCHWCHVMDETTYSSEEIISYINEHVIPIRVDSDLRPDIDTLYNQGGWPSTVILLPQGEILNGGNYISPEEMLPWLKKTETMFTTDPNGITSRLEEIKTMRMMERDREKGLKFRPRPGDLDSIEQLLATSFDSVNGGFGNNQKFPNSDAVGFLLSRYAMNKSMSAKKIVRQTLDQMAKGEIHDRVEGGFFRYATRPDWSMPHYEKMLEVNAGIVKNFAEASLMMDRDKNLAMCNDILQFVQKNLFDQATGAFYGSQDADENYYKRPNRKGAHAPLVDRTSYADSSAQMISALVSVHYATGRKHYLEMAARAVAFIQNTMDAGADGMYHSFRNNAPALKGQLSDNALFGSALLDLYNATGDKRYLTQAIKIGKLISEKYFDGKATRFRSMNDGRQVELAITGDLAELNDNLANYRALRLISRLLYYGDYPGWRDIRDAVVMNLSSEYRKFTPHAGTFGTMLLVAVGEPVQITIVSESNGSQKYLPVINRIYVPERVVRVFSPSEDAAEIKRLKYPLQEAVYVCVGKRCSAPISDPKQLGKVVRELVGSPSSH